MDDEHDDMSPEEFVSMLADALENDDDTEVVAATPWSNQDTTAVAMMFAANISIAASEMFRSMALLALGQSAHDWAEQDDKSFTESFMSSLGMIPEASEKGDDDGGNGRVSSPK